MTEPPPPSAYRSLPSARLGVLRTAGVILYYPFALLVFALFWLACAFDRLLPLPLPFPRHPDALGKREAWCVARLVKAGAMPAGAVVTRFEVRPFKRGEVFRSSLAEVTLAYEHGGASHTLELVAKFGAQFGTITAHVISILQRNALNEIQFYNAHGGQGPALRCYYAKAAGLAGQFCILLERVRPAFQITEEAGAPIACAREAAVMFARFHAAHWRGAGATAPTRRPRVPVRVPGLSIDFMCSLAWGRRRRTSRQLARVAWHYGNVAQTVVHGDARIRNMLFRGEEGGVPTRPVLIDWQATRWGLAAYDLAYFALVSLPPATRAAHEEELLALYHRELVLAGVTGYGLGELREDYRHSVLLVFSLLFLPLLGGEQTLDADNRAAATSVAMAWHERVIAALETFDRPWVEARYRIDVASFRDNAEWIATHPHPLNSGARLVAAEMERRRMTS